jgi:penicillin-binding protein 2
MTPGPTRLRLGILGLVVVSLFAVMLARLWYLQVLDAPMLQAAAERNQVRLVPEPAPRGRILDRHGRVLVDNRVSNVVAINRALLRDRDGVLTRLAPLLGVAPDELARRLDDPRFSPYKPVPVAEDVGDDVVVYIREHRRDFRGVVAAQVAQRAYPYGSLGAHLLGYVGEINGRELEQRRAQGYRLGDAIGKSGVELVYEHALRGEPGVQKFEVDSRGRVLRSLGYRPPAQGNDLQLTIDVEVQLLAEESLAQGLAAARQTFDREHKKFFLAPAGAVVVLDPRDGSALALASNPTFNPADFVNGIKPELFRALQDPASHFPLNNRVIQGQYAPGSTFKLMTSLAGLASGLITPRTTILDSGTFTIRNCRGRCTFRNAGGRVYGRVDLVQALTVSSDVYYYSLGNTFWQQRERVGDRIQQTAKELGLGAPTGVVLPFEARGRIPDPEVRKRLHDDNPKAFPNGRWFAGDNVNLAIGQGEMVVTPLQLANAYAGFANGGTIHAPRVATRTIDRDGRTAQTFEPTVVRRLTLPAGARESVLAGLESAVTNPRGTAHGAFAGFPIDRLPVAGKTGTAQVVGKQDTALFVALAPARAPEYVIGVVMEEAGFGGQSAAPVARRILEGIAGLAPGAVRTAGGVD